MILSVVGKCMRAGILLLAASFFTHAENINIVKVPDVEFKQALFNAGVDKNNDGLIQLYEAKTIQTLNLTGKRIKSLKGIDAFVNLKTLYCSNNNLDSLDLSHNLLLTELNCSWNQLKYLNLKGCVNLVDLGCGSNYLTSLDLNSNTSLLYLNCSKNTGLKSICISVPVTEDFIKDDTAEWKHGC